jgi:hypothetical protein
MVQLPFVLYHSVLKQPNAALIATQRKWNKPIREDKVSESSEVSGDQLNSAEQNSRT